MKLKLKRVIIVGCAVATMMSIGTTALAASDNSGNADNARGRLVARAAQMFKLTKEERAEVREQVQVLKDAYGTLTDEECAELRAEIDALRQEMLSLTDAQREEYRAKIDALRDQLPDLTQEEREAFRDQIASLRDAMKSVIAQTQDAFRTQAADLIADACGLTDAQRAEIRAAIDALKAQRRSIFQARRNAVAASTEAVDQTS